MEKPLDLDRRKILTTAASIIGCAGVVGAAMPITASMMPSEKVKALGADVAVDISGIRPGEMKVVEWRRQPVWILSRTKEMLNDIAATENHLKDPRSIKKSQQPDYARNRYRSVNEKYLVVVGICTHLGCAPRYMPEHGIKQVGEWWKGGFFCPCHDSSYDLAGRVFKGSPAPMNLPVPPHYFVNNNVLVIGDQELENKVD